MTLPEPLPAEEATRVLREAARYTAVVLLIGNDPDDPESLFIDEVRNPSRELADRELAESLRQFADRLDARAQQAGQ
ncbi:MULTISPECIES: hypothetical protein [Nocardia]|uniref:hypothetical protein n=1 Tax=Nocardia TaxID=1817 RepID=UPI0007A3BC92|nr:MULTISPECIES: hypothetical protein [Nocardia]